MANRRDTDRKIDKIDAICDRLAKAVQMEAEGKPPGLVSKALDKAVEYENAANGKFKAAA